MKFHNALTIAVTGLLITSAPASVTIDWVTVGNAENSADTNSFGMVNYSYNIGKYEVTNAQYSVFLNAVAKTDSYFLYHSSMASYGITRSGSSGSYTYNLTPGLENRPVMYISWFDAARFTNWLANGQGSGDTETGSYTLNGATSGIITTNVGATIWIPTEDEWYKAAYYNGANSTYSRYTNGQNSITTADANYGSTVGSTTNVGTYSSDASYYGTFDQGGNVWEWNASVYSSETKRGLRGGAYFTNYSYLDSSLLTPYSSTPQSSNIGFGFRLASGAIPEPASPLMCALGANLLLRRRRK